MATDKARDLFRKFSCSFNYAVDVFLLYVKALISNIYLASESNDFIEDSPSLLNLHIGIIFFFSDNGACMDTVTS